MLSLTQFRHHLFPLFMVMRGTGQIFEVVYKNQVYDVHIRKTNKIAHLTRSKRESRSVKLNAIDTGQCPVCGTIQINGVCMNSACANHA